MPCQLTGSRAHMDPLGQVPSVTKTGFGTGNRSVPFLGIGGTFEAPSALTGTSLVSVTSVSLEETFVQESCEGEAGLTPDEGLLGLVEGQGGLLEAFLRQLLVRLAQPLRRGHRRIDRSARERG